VTGPVAIGVDIGGTKIAFALVDRSGVPLVTHRLPTPVSAGPEAVFAAVVEGIHHVAGQSEQRIAGIGIGSPGHLNPETGLIYKATNLAWDNVNLLDGIRRHLNFQAPLWLQRDANAAALGELYFGAAHGVQDFVLVTIGTGLGGSAVVAGEIVGGATHSGMEIGHMPLNPSGRLCLCGMRGCPEMYVPGVGLLAGVREYAPEYPHSPLASTEPVTTAHILEAFHSGDPLAARLVEDATDWLCSVMIACISILNPALFVIGGGLGHAVFDVLAPRIEAKVTTRTRPEIHRPVPIVQSHVRNSAIGPACIVWHLSKEG
jgi:glucokinase